MGEAVAANSTMARADANKSFPSLTSNSSQRTIPLLIRYESSSTSSLSSSKDGSIASATASAFSQKQQQQLHAGIEEGLLKGRNSTSSAANSAAAASTAPKKEAEERRRRYQQAAVNAICSFMVVLLAAQSLKSGSERRKAELHLTAALEVLSETRDKLKQVTKDEQVQAMAAACVRATMAAGHQNQSNQPHFPNDQDTEPQSRKSSNRWWWNRTQSSNSSLTGTDPNDGITKGLDPRVVAAVTAVLQKQLHAMVGDAALTEAEQDHRRVLNLARQQQQTTTTASIIVDDQDSDDDAETLLLRALLLPAEGEDDSAKAAVEQKDADGTRVIKKRVFSI